MSETKSRERFLPRPGSFRKTHKQPEQPFQGHMPESFLSILGEFHIQSLSILVHFHQIFKFFIDITILT